MDEGVPANIVIRVLRAHNVAVSLKDEVLSLYTLEKGDFFEDAVLKDTIGKRYLFTLKRKCGIPISHFWNPEQAESKP